MSKPSDVQFNPEILRRVQLTPPPPEHTASITKAVEQFANTTLEPGQQGGLVGVVHKRGDELAMNMAIVQRIGKKSTVVGFIAKEWGEPIGVGGAWSLRW